MCAINNCSLCGAITFKKQGHYFRKIYQDDDSLSFVMVSIQRYYCHSCKGTFSVLPRWLPPRLWYAWSVKEKVMLALLSYSSLSCISRRFKIARSTIRRWTGRLQEQFICHSDQLKQLLPDVLGRTNSFIDFWRSCLSNFSLIQVINYLRHNGVKIT